MTWEIRRLCKKFWRWLYHRKSDSYLKQQYLAYHPGANGLLFVDWQGIGERISAEFRLNR